MVSKSNIWSSGESNTEITFLWKCLKDEQKYFPHSGGRGTVLSATTRPGRPQLGTLLQCRPAGCPERQLVPMALTLLQGASPLSNFTVTDRQERGPDLKSWLGLSFLQSKTDAIQAPYQRSTIVTMFSLFVPPAHQGVFKTSFSQLPFPDRHPGYPLVDEAVLIHNS